MLLLFEQVRQDDLWLPHTHEGFTKKTGLMADIGSSYGFFRSLVLIGEAITPFSAGKALANFPS